MSYCRWLEGDVYMFASCEGGIECCSCLLAPKVKSIFTTGSKDGDPLFKNKIEPCDQCEGRGCEDCMMYGSLHFYSYEDAIQHLRDHVAAGHEVPQRAFDGLREDAANGESLEKICDGPMIVDFKKGEAKSLNDWLEDQKGEEWKDQDSPGPDDWKNIEDDDGQ